jgi:hypothetical protein
VKLPQKVLIQTPEARGKELFGQPEKPWISLTYDGFLETNNPARIAEFAELIKFYRGSQER